MTHPRPSSAGSRIGAAALAALLFFGSTAQAAPEPPEVAEPPPNVVIVMIDDLSEEGVDYMPNLQHIAAQGTQFSNAFAVSAQCQSVRAANWTGVAPWTARYRSNEDGNRQFGPRDRGDFRNWKHFNYRAIETLPEAVRNRSGLVTVTGGKVYHQFYRRKNPDRRSFEQVLLPAKRGERPQTSSVFRVGHKKMGYVRFERSGQTHTSDMMDAAVEYLQTTKDPYFMTVGIYPPHEHWYVEPHHLDAIPDWVPIPRGYVSGHTDPQANGKAHLVEPHPEAWNTARRYYYASAALADEALGKVWAARDPDAYFIVQSDHGYCLGERDNWGGKAMVTRCAAAIPWVIAGPDIPIQTVDAYVSSMDLYPTVMGLLDLDLPEHVYGNDLSNTIRYGGEYPDLAITAHGKRDGIRWRDADGRAWLYAANRRTNNRVSELYDLDADPQEIDNIIDRHPDKVVEALNLLAAETGQPDLYPIPQTLLPERETLP
ncbi:MAG: sulfatase-like hydrolase/transferase [Pseudomonadota bacterium]